MSTKKLYYNDAYQKEFQAEVVKVIPSDEGLFAVILDQTAFYPESGGQPSDHGMLGSMPVLNIREEGDEVIHIVSKAPDTKQITGAIHWPRRFDHMQQHSGQHILSAAVHQLTGAETVGFHLGAASCQIDLSLDELTEEKVKQIEELANQIVTANLPVRIHYATRETLTNFPVRKLPPADVDNIRLIEVTDIDCCPCGGTHVSFTSEIGLIKIRSWERKKGLVRVDFVCGGRALQDYQMINTIVNKLSARFSSPVPELLQAVEKHFARDEQLEKQFALIKQDYNRLLAKDLLAQSEVHQRVKIVTHVLPNALPQDVTDLAKQLAANECVIALIAGINAEQSKNHLTFSCSPGVKVNMGEQLKAVLPLINGKGGGSAQSAQGGGSEISQTGLAIERAKENIVSVL